MVLLLLLSGCALRSGSATPLATPIRYPATWTPAPTFTPRPPTPTATLVLSDADRATAVAQANKLTRRYPPMPNGIAGAWADTTDLTTEAMAGLSPLVQLAFGPRALSLRRTNPQVMALARVDAVAIKPSSSPQVGDYDGLWVDNLTVREGADGIKAASDLLKALRSPLGDRLLIAGTSFWNDGGSYTLHSGNIPSLLAQVDGACMCDFLRRADEDLETFKDAQAWKKDIDGLTGLSSTNHGITLVATRFSQVSDNEAGTLSHWFDYALASFLIGAQGTSSYFSFQGPHADEFMTGVDAARTLGFPAGSYYESYGTFSRRFRNGLVIVNPGTGTREIPLGLPYINQQGETITRVILEAHTGVILSSAR